MRHLPLLICKSKCIDGQTNLQYLKDCRFSLRRLRREIYLFFRHSGRKVGIFGQNYVLRPNELFTILFYIFHQRKAVGHPNSCLRGIGVKQSSTVIFLHFFLL